MRTSANDFKTLFYQGDYSEILKRTVDASSWSKKGQDLSFVIGALAFKGRMEEAQILATSVLAQKEVSVKVRTRFFLGLGFTRLSEYDKAIRIFTDNYRLVRKSKLSLENKFYIYQGVSFYRFYCGRFAAAKRASDVAFKSAFEADEPYGKALATDLRSHILIMLGESSAGFELRNRAIHIAKLLSNKSLATAFQISTMVDRARLGFTPKKALQELMEATSSVKPEDNYSRANFLLELSRQLTLRGRITEAGQFLDQASEVIYAHQNRRQETSLNLRYAHLHYCSGEYSRGLSAIRSAKRTVHPKVDRVLELEALGLELKLVRALKMESQIPQIEKQIRQRTNADSNFIHHRIQARQIKKFAGDGVRRGMDPLGDLIDLVHSNPSEAIDGILGAGYNEFFYELIGVDRQKPTLCVDLRPGLVISLDRGEVIVADGLTSLLRRVLRVLSEGASSKEEIFAQGWGFKYDSLRHDTVIYAAINSLRKLFGEKASWIETVENGYRLRAEVRCDFQNSEESQPSPSKQPAQTGINQASGKPVENSLNYRQMQILRHLAKMEFIDVQDCKRIFAVSDITASRDLSTLTGFGHLVRIGKGRATKYGLR